MRRAVLLLLLLSLGALAGSPPETVLQPGRSPLISFRILWKTGAAYDPPGKAGLASLTADMLAGGGTRKLTFTQLLKRLYPLAATISSSCDKQMTVFSGTVHRDNLNAFYALLREMLLDPGFRPEDFERLKAEAENYLKVDLRGDNDEELGKELLYNWIYLGHPYGHYNGGALDQLSGLTLEDVRRFYRDHYHPGNLMLGLAGGYPAGLPERVAHDFAMCPPGEQAELTLPAPAPIEGIQVELVQKKTRSSAISLGFPMDVNRRHPDWVALYLAASYLGEHRSANSHLYQRLREIRGLNYGDYAYIEYFPRGMFQTEPDPNLARDQQIFQIWIRPVEPAKAHFVLRAALFELRKLLKEGIPPADFENTRQFLNRRVAQLVKGQSARLGYALDSRWYGLPDFPTMVREGLARLTPEDVNRAMRARWQADNLKVVIVTDHAQALAEALRTDRPSPIRYNSPKAAEILAEDAEIAGLPLKPSHVEVVPVEQTLR